MTTVESIASTLDSDRSPLRKLQRHQVARRSGGKPVHRNDSGRCDWSLNMIRIGGPPGRYWITVNAAFAALMPSHRAAGAPRAARTNQITI